MLRIPCLQRGPHHLGSQPPNCFLNRDTGRMSAECTSACLRRGEITPVGEEGNCLTRKPHCPRSYRTMVARWPLVRLSTSATKSVMAMGRSGRNHYCSRRCDGPNCILLGRNRLCRQRRLGNVGASRLDSPSGYVPSIWSGLGIHEDRQARSQRYKFTCLGHIRPPVHRREVGSFSATKFLIFRTTDSGASTSNSTAPSLYSRE